uniref:Interleukin-6 n=1 Tax=Oryctolagus cuniculus TaxID=9986 RepID=A0A5F9C5I1_RABIT
LSQHSPVASSLGLLLVVATAFHTPLPLTEGFTNDATSNIPQSTAGKAGEHMIHITKKIFELREKMCDYNAKCLNRTAALAAPDLNLPKLTEKDKCSPTALNKEICLMRITIELLEFQIYLEYIQNKFRNDEENARAKDVQISLQVETELLMQKVSASSLLTLYIGRETERKHLGPAPWLNRLILCLAVFLEHSLRAMHMM